VTISNGTSRGFGPGTILFAEDVRGKGHTARSLGGEEHL
jgi:hypothetical protein